MTELDLTTIENDWTRRRYHLGREASGQRLKCPGCGSEQLQLVKYLMKPPAGWKCRRCKFEFDWEPCHVCPSYNGAK